MLLVNDVDGPLRTGLGVVPVRFGGQLLLPGPEPLIRSLLAYAGSGPVLSRERSAGVNPNLPPRFISTFTARV